VLLSVVTLAAHKLSTALPLELVLVLLLVPPYMLQPWSMSPVATARRERRTSVQALCKLLATWLKDLLRHSQEAWADTSCLVQMALEADLLVKAATAAAEGTAGRATIAATIAACVSKESARPSHTATVSDGIERTRTRHDDEEQRGGRRSEGNFITWNSQNPSNLATMRDAQPTRTTFFDIFYTPLPGVDFCLLL